MGGPYEIGMQMPYSTSILFDTLTGGSLSKHRTQRAGHREKSIRLRKKRRRVEKAGRAAQRSK